MKRRTFLTTLLLFLTTINLGVMLIAVNTYRDTVRQARERAAAEHYFIASGLLRDIEALDSRGVDYRQDIATLTQSYGYLTDNQRAGISLYDGDNLVYSNIGKEIPSNIPILSPNKNRMIVLAEQEDETAVFVTGRLPEPYDSYLLLYRSEIAQTLSEWQEMKTTMFITGLFLSGFLAISLLILLGRLFKPLTDISITSRQIASGEYATRLAVKGKDELSEMAQNFNHMADEIERQMEELITTAENKQLFIDNFAHELKTPLTAIYGYAEYLQKASVPEEDRHFALACILSESSRIQTMAYQMMELANLRAEQIHMKSLSVSELLHKVKTAIMPKAQEKDIDILFFCELSHVYGNDSLLESLLINLIDNAIKASNTGGKVVIKAIMDGVSPVITVEDHGKGIPKEALDHVIQPYYRVEKHRHRRDGGAGLGLAICEQIAARHKATLSFSSSPGYGTTVKITFTTP